MPQLRFRVVSLADQPNEQGLPMVRVQLKAVEGEAFVSDAEQPKGTKPCPPDGFLSLLVSESYAKKFTRGELVDLPLRDLNRE